MKVRYIKSAIYSDINSFVEKKDIYHCSPKCKGHKVVMDKGNNHYAFVLNGCPYEKEQPSLFSGVKA